MLTKTLPLMYSQQEINNFVKEMAGLDDLKPRDDLMNDLGGTGDDFHELIDAYAKLFNVDIEPISGTSTLKK